MAVTEIASDKPLAAGSARWLDGREEILSVGLVRPALRRPRPSLANQHRLSLNLHDHAGQAIALLMLDLHRLGDYVHCAQGREHLTRIRQQLDRMGGDLHRLAEDLRPASLETWGLGEALQAKTDEFCRAFPIAARFETLGDCDTVPDGVADAMFNVAQEALTNVVRHAGSVKRVSVRLARRRTAMVLIVADDGLRLGRPAGGKPKARGSRHMGLHGIRQRVAWLGGRVRFLQPKSGGWVVYVTVPVQAASPLDEDSHGPTLSRG